MDAAKKKALFRAKLNAQKKDKRIDSPLVRYNESDQPVCRVCNVALKSEALWDAHQASRKHHEAIESIKASAAGRTNVYNVKPESRTESTRPKHEEKAELHDKNLEPSTKSSMPQPSSTLPPDFFDNNLTKRQKTGLETVKSVESDSYKPSGNSVSHNDSEMDGFPCVNGLPTRNTQHTGEFKTVATEIAVSDTKKSKGALPEGFFDNKEADLRARGIKPVKPDVKDEYKEFEKLIQEDIQNVDNRLEEEEIDAAEMMEQAETLEQKAYWERVEILRNKKMELKAARSVKNSKDSGVPVKESSLEDSSSDDDGDDNFAVDWRAQHL